MLYAGSLPAWNFNVISSVFSHCSVLKCILDLQIKARSKDSIAQDFANAYIFSLLPMYKYPYCHTGSLVGFHFVLFCIFVCGVVILEVTIKDFNLRSSMWELNWIWALRGGL